MPSTSKELAQGLYGVLKTTPERSDELIKKFADIIVDAGLSSYIGRIADELTILLEEDSEDSHIRGKAAHSLEIKGISVEEDSRLIAGAILSRGEYVVDTSIKSRLSVIKNSANV